MHLPAWHGICLLASIALPHKEHVRMNTAYSKSIEDIPILVSSGKMTLKDGIGSIAEEIFRCPFRFGLQNYDEDFRSDIIETFLEKGHLVLKHYRPSVGDFRPYLYSFVQGLILTKRRDTARHQISELSLKQYFSDSTLLITCTSVSSSTFPDELTIRKTASSGSRLWNLLRRGPQYAATPDAKTALILALKSSFYIPSDTIDRVSSFCGIDSEDMHRLIDKLNIKLDHRACMRKKLISKRDDAYYFHRRYLLQMKYGNGEHTDMKAVYRKYVRQTKIWNNRNFDLTKCRFRVCPTNKTVADILGICERQVSYYIKRARDINGDNRMIV